MNRQIFLSLLLSLIVSSCLKSASDPVVIEHYIPSEGISSVLIEMDSGQINLVRGSEEKITVTSTSAEPDSLLVSQEDNVLNLMNEGSGSADILTLQVPDGLSFYIKTFSADSHLQRLKGQVKIRSTAGDIQLNSFTGSALLWAGRGNVSVLNGQGDLVVIGEHGELTVEGFSGSVSMTSIMGKIQFLGSDQRTGPIHLETDHGPVQAALPESSSYHIKVNTTSGKVTCSSPTIIKTPNGCEGIIGEGEKEFNIRTVSGRVDLSLIPGNPEETND
jgi:DUF4097 and DUF4098 domain-containing protein YvlB